MDVKLLQDDLRKALEEHRFPDGSVLGYAGRHRLGTGTSGNLRLQDGLPVVNVGDQTINFWFAGGPNWVLPSRRNVARLAKWFGMRWLDALFLILKLEWEAFLIEGPRDRPIRLSIEADLTPGLLRQPALPLDTPRSYQRPTGGKRDVEDYDDLLDEFMDVYWPRIAPDIEADLAAAYGSVIPSGAFAVQGALYGPVREAVLGADMHRLSLCTPEVRQWIADLGTVEEQWQRATEAERGRLVELLLEWHSASRCFDAAAVTLELARVVRSDTERDWAQIFGEVRQRLLVAHHFKEKLRNFVIWLENDPCLSDEELEQRYRESYGPKDEAEMDELKELRVIQFIRDQLRGEGADPREIDQYFADVKQLYREIALLTHPDSRRHSGIADNMRAILEALWQEATVVKRGDTLGGTLLRRYELHRLVKRAREVWTKLGRSIEKPQIPLGVDLPETIEALRRAVTAMQSDERRLRAEIVKLQDDQELQAMRADLTPRERVADRVAAYDEEIGHLTAEAVALKARIAEERGRSSNSA